MRGFWLVKFIDFVVCTEHMIYFWMISLIFSTSMAFETKFCVRFLHPRKLTCILRIDAFQVRNLRNYRWQPFVFVWLSWICLVGDFLRNWTTGFIAILHHHLGEYVCHFFQASK